MEEKKNILSIIETKKVNFSKGQKRIAEFILNNFHEAVYLTAAELSRKTDVSESTVVRFAAMLGFEGYPELSDALEKLARENLDASKRIEVSANFFSKSHKHILKSVMQSDADRIMRSLQGIDEDVFDKAVDKILDARKIYIIGARSSSSLAEFLAFHLNLMLGNVISFSGGTEVYEQIFRISENDVCICFSFPRYSQRTINAMQYAFSQNANTIAVTDNIDAPICKYANYKLIVKSDMISIVDSLVSAMSLVNAILVAISVRKKIEITQTYDKLEKLWTEHKVYSKTVENIEDPV